VIAAAIVFVAAQGIAIAQTPPGCTANSLFVGFSKDKTLITSGETVNYSINITNSTAGGGCDVVDTDVVFHCPAANGTPTGSNVVLTTTGNFPADGSGNTCWNSTGSGGCIANAGLSCVVTLTTVPGTATARVNVGATPTDLTKGKLLDSPTGSGFDASKDLNLDVVECTTNSQCDDTLFCTDDLCVSNVCQHSAHPCAADADLCTTESCDETANACVSSAPPSCDDAEVCTDDSCVPATGQCQHIFDPENAEICSPDEFCRTPGFWGTHADADDDKDCSQNITQAVIDAAGGSIDVCGVTICNTLVDDEGSAVEAMCMKVQGTQTRQLIRQLTAARLNCIVSGETGGACDGISINAVYDACNAACALGNVTADVGSNEDVSCISAIDCFNNGGQYDFEEGACFTGTCQLPEAGALQPVLCSADVPCPIGECVPFANNCHSAEFPDEFDLPNDSLSASDPCFEKQGPAGSSDECKAAHKTPCALPDNLDACDTNECAP
jgi:hypothetical protein